MFWTFVHPCDRPESLCGNWDNEDMSVDPSSDPSDSTNSDTDSDTSDTCSTFSDSVSDEDFLGGQ